MSLHHKVFLVLLVCSPFQLAYHFWPKFSYVLGLPVDYLSPTIYFTDLLIIIILFLGLREIPKWIWLVLILEVINLAVSNNFQISLLKIIKINEMILLGFYVYKNAKIIGLERIKSALLVAIGITFIIAFGQFLKQGDLGLWLLGERPLSLAQTGIAKININGELILRPYATFPHPNAMAGFVLVAGGILFLGKKKNLLVLGMGLIIILISFSRSVWLVTGGSLLLSLKNKRLLILGIIGFLVLGSTMVFFNPESFDQRLYLNKVAIEIIKETPLLGIGWNNFLVKLPEFWQPGQVFLLQPVHNIYLLLLTETGLVGFVGVLYFLVLTVKNLVKKNNWVLIGVWLVIGFLGLTDHYWLTLQQNLILLAVVSGLSWC